MGEHGAFGMGEQEIPGMGEHGVFGIGEQEIPGMGEHGAQVKVSTEHFNS